ncbi:MAG: anaerobic ribonucleoside-triphosphate reductase activating protein [Rickettsiaceae bacterium]|nr:anaerobic ribonucleoside-triphosphate reductase activating protein [Rickettsiaceae bacterium]
MVKVPICDITPFTMQDFPEHIAAILWFAGCNLRCKYCHNPSLVFRKLPLLPWKDVSGFLESRKNLLDGIVLSGGECTLSHGLFSLITYIRDLGYKVKLDSNGLKPDVLEKLLSSGMLDYVALDFKAPEYKFSEVTSYDAFRKFDQSLKCLIESKIPLEIRTTVHTDLLSVPDINVMIEHLANSGFVGNYYLQNFRMSPKTLGNLPDQKFPLNIDEITHHPTISLKLRNF